MKKKTRQCVRFALPSLHIVGLFFFFPFFLALHLRHDTTRQTEENHRSFDEHLPNFRSSISAIVFIVSYRLIRWNFIDLSIIINSIFHWTNFRLFPSKKQKDKRKTFVFFLQWTTTKTNWISTELFNDCSNVNWRWFRNEWKFIELFF